MGKYLALIFVSLMYFKPAHGLEIDVERINWDGCDQLEQSLSADQRYKFNKSREKWLTERVRVAKTNAEQDSDKVELKQAMDILEDNEPHKTIAENNERFKTALAKLAMVYNRNNHLLTYDDAANVQNMFLPKFCDSLRWAGIVSTKSTGSKSGSGATVEDLKAAMDAKKKAKQ